MSVTFIFFPLKSMVADCPKWDKTSPTAWTPSGISLLPFDFQKMRSCRHVSLFRGYVSFLSTETLDSVCDFSRHDDDSREVTARDQLRGSVFLCAPW